MPIFVATLLGGLAQAAGSLVGRVLLALGMGFVSYQGLDLVLDGLRVMFVDNLALLDARVVQALGVMNVDRAFTLIMSAIAARLLIQGLSSGAVKRLVVKP